MSYMFYQCISLEDLNIDSFGTINAKDMKGIFCACIKLKEIKLHGLNLNNIKNMDYMFRL